MFDQMRFEHTLVNLVLELIASERRFNPDLPLSWTPYGMPRGAMIQIAIAFEGGRFRDLRPRHRAIKTALELLESDMVPDNGKHALFLTTLLYVEKCSELEFSAGLIDRARAFLAARGLSG